MSCDLENAVFTLRGVWWWLKCLVINPKSFLVILTSYKAKRLDIILS
jgi:hypothetical protein